ncbi:hypothetical protein BJV85_002948 [Clostridium acetobutylicum]|nr:MULTISPECIES: hypothetical protein [Clostridium]MBC2395254.1 hypothetical protein [Clostridium acetobutylicum]NOV89871.1 hypothetical protein [Clostridium acetobutylicum]NOW15600.1 hypothetical protein [Clostridium acetobutylicum]NRY57279.1 hypothetical protein [Clostridium acetobutylicum]NSA94025.1 hypothetical protein [Clostridium acetobutylicum]
MPYLNHQIDMYVKELANYNDSGIRTEKTVIGVTTKCQYSEIISKT